MGDIGGKEVGGVGEEEKGVKGEEEGEVPVPMQFLHRSFSESASSLSSVAFLPMQFLHTPLCNFCIASFETAYSTRLIPATFNSAFSTSPFSTSPFNA